MFDESLNYNVYPGKTRIFDLDHILWGLEASGYRGISKDDVGSMKFPINVQEYLKLEDPVEVRGIH